MKIRLGQDCFVREADGEGVWVCPKGEGGCRVAGGGMLARLVGREWRDLGTVYGEMAAAYGVTAEDVERDFAQVVGTLVGLGLLEAEGSSAEKAQTGAGKPEEEAREEGISGDAMGFWKDHGIPAELHVDLTSACTERCVHCYYPEHGNRHLPFGLAEKALREFRAMGGLTVHLTGGECMLHPRFEDVCRLCAGLGLNFVVLSNLTPCDARRAAFLGEVRPQFVNVSLYSTDAAEHDAVTRVPGSWLRTMEAIGECAKAGVAVRLAAPLLKENRKAFPSLKRFADAHGMHLVPECTIVPQTNRDCSNLDHACSPAELEEALRAAPGIFDRGWGAAPMPGPEDKVCDIGTGRLYLNAEGDYYPCDGMHGFVLGNARERTAGEIWRGERLEALRQLENRDFGACAACGHRPFCKVCPAFNFNATGDILKTIPAKCAVAAVLHRVYGRKRR
jgi:radical SAM protein with 4Fe4S-binding SPASM domain